MFILLLILGMTFIGLSRDCILSAIVVKCLLYWAWPCVSAGHDCVSLLGMTVGYVSLLVELSVSAGHGCVSLCWCDCVSRLSCDLRLCLLNSATKILIK